MAPGSDAVPMRLSMRAEHEIPIYLATLSPAMLKLTGEKPTVGSAPVSFPKALGRPTSPISTKVWPAAGAPEATSTCVRALRWPLRPTRMRCAKW